MMSSERYLVEMFDSYNCLRLDNGKVFQVGVYQDNDGKFFKLGNDEKIQYEKLKVGQLAKLISSQEKFEVSKLWSVDVDKSKLNPGSTKEDIEKLEGVSMEFEHRFEKYFKADWVFTDNIHIVATTTTDQGLIDISRCIAELGYLPRQGGRGGTSLIKKEQDAYTAEGISLTDPDINQRSDLVSSLAKRLEQRSVILFQAPPYSGKTSLAQLLENYLVVNNPSEILRVIRVSLLWGSSNGKKCEYDTFCDVWKKVIGVGWYEWVEQCEKIQTVLIMDETQRIYETKNEDDEEEDDDDENDDDVSMRNAGTAVEFWGTIKECLQGTNLSVIMFAAYGYGTNSAGLSTPLFIPLDNSMGLAELRFTDEELKTYVNSYCAKNFGLSSDNYIVSQFIRYIKHATVGHVGFVRHILQHTKDAMQHRIRNNDLTWKRIYAYLNSDNFSGTVDDCRAAPKLSKLSDDQLKICQDVCLKGKIGFNDSVDNKYLIRSGVLVITVINNQRYLQFAAPLIERSFFQQFYGKETRAVSTPDSLYDFIVGVFKIMSEESVEILNDSLGTGKDKKLLEQTWQKEFYRIGTRVLGNDYFLSCDVGAYYGSEGNIDFYIDGLEWAVELLREGLDMEEHDRRFDETTGIYKEIVEVAKETVIIDIRSDSKKVRELKERFVHVSYSENYDAYVIECLGKETVKIEIRYP